MNLTDTHLHLCDAAYDHDKEAVINNAKEIGTKFLLNVSLDADTIEPCLKLSDEYDFIYTALGYHPCYVNNSDDLELRNIRKYLSNDKVVAIGETGLDYFHNTNDIAEQKKYFVKHIELAKEFELPLVIHARDAYEDVLKILRDEGAGKIKGVMHCFSGTLNNLEDTLKLGFMVGIGGPVTFKNGENVRKIVEELPVESLLIETDAPYLAPVPRRGKRNEPAYVKYIAETIADVKNISLEDLCEVTLENSRKLFKW